MTPTATVYGNPRFYDAHYYAHHYALNSLFDSIVITLVVEQMIKRYAFAFFILTNKKLYLVYLVFQVLLIYLYHKQINIIITFNGYN